jgi:hypothetical protein
VAVTIYFSGSITGGRADVAHYRRMVNVLEEVGHRVLAGSVAAETVGEGGDALDPRAIFDRDMAWLAEADVLVAEVSVPSTGVGYEIAAARYLYRIPVVALYRPAFTSRCSAMISGDEGIEVIEYAEDRFDAMVVRLRGALEELAVRRS